MLRCDHVSFLIHQSVPSVDVVKLLTLAFIVSRHVAVLGTTRLHGAVRAVRARKVLVIGSRVVVAALLTLSSSTSSFMSAAQC